jgi:hypothetical protein
MFRIREWFNFIFLVLLLGSYVLLGLALFARALVGLIRHRHNDARTVTIEGEDGILNDTQPMIVLSDEAFPSYSRRQHQSVTRQRMEAGKTV